MALWTKTFSAVYQTSPKKSISYTVSIQNILVIQQKQDNGSYLCKFFITYNNSSSNDSAGSTTGGEHAWLKVTVNGKTYTITTAPKKSGTLNSHPWNPAKGIYAFEQTYDTKQESWDFSFFFKMYIYGVVNSTHSTTKVLTQTISRADTRVITIFDDELYIPAMSYLNINSDNDEDNLGYFTPQYGNITRDMNIYTQGDFEAIRQRMAAIYQQFTTSEKQIVCPDNTPTTVTTDPFELEEEILTEQDDGLYIDTNIKIKQNPYVLALNAIHNILLYEGNNELLTSLAGPYNAEEDEANPVTDTNFANVARLKIIDKINHLQDIQNGNYYYNVNTIIDDLLDYCTLLNYWIKYKFWGYTTMASLLEEPVTIYHGNALAYTINHKAKATHAVGYNGTNQVTYFGAYGANNPSGHISPIEHTELGAQLTANNTFYGAPSILHIVCKPNVDIPRAYPNNGQSISSLSLNKPVTLMNTIKLIIKINDETVATISNSGYTSKVSVTGTGVFENYTSTSIAAQKTIDLYVRINDISTIENISLFTTFACHTSPGGTQRVQINYNNGVSIFYNVRYGDFYQYTALRPSVTISKFEIL